MGWPVSTTHSIVGGIVGAALTVGFITGKGGLDMVQWGGIGTIAISWVLSPVLGGLAAFILFKWIKTSILVYNEEADQKLREIKTRRAELRQEHKSRFSRLNEIQQISYTNAMARDAALVAEEDFDPDQLESEYYRDLYNLNKDMDNVKAHRALESWVPVLAAIGAIIISAMVMFKGLKHTGLDFSVLQNLLVMGMVGAVVWMAVFIFARSLKKSRWLSPPSFSFLGCRYYRFRLRLLPRFQRHRQCHWPLRCGY